VNLEILFSLFTSFFKIGFFAFGGGYGALSMIQDEIVNVHNWMNSQQFLDLLSISQMTPGPIAINAATYIGYRMNGVPGAFAATIGVILPSFIWVFIFLKLMSLASKKIDTSKVIDALKIAILVPIFLAGINLSIASVRSLSSLLIGIIVFVILKFRKIPLFWLVLISGFIGVLFGKYI
jgi:chromate transporter